MDLTLLRSKVPRCQHLKADGVQCNLPAVGRRPFCHRHAAMHRAITRTADARNAPLIHVEDLASLQLALNDVIQRLLRGQLDHRDASIIIRSLRTMLSAMRMEQDSPTYGPDVVRNPSQLAPHVDWRRHMTPEEKQQKQEGEGRSINTILTKVARHLAQEANIDCSELGPEEDDGPVYDDDGNEVAVGPDPEPGAEPHVIPNINAAAVQPRASSAAHTRTPRPAARWSTNFNISSGELLRLTDALSPRVQSSLPFAAVDGMAGPWLC